MGKKEKTPEKENFSKGQLFGLLESYHKLKAIATHTKYDIAVEGKRCFSFTLNHRRASKSKPELYLYQVYPSQKYISSLYPLTQNIYLVEQ